MKKYLIPLLLVAFLVTAFTSCKPDDEIYNPTCKISKIWYRSDVGYPNEVYVYDEKGKKICGLSRSSVGELKGWCSDFFVAKRYSFYYICDAKGKTLKTMSVSNVGEIVGVSGCTITSRKGNWIYTWSKEGKKISATNAE